MGRADRDAWDDGARGDDAAEPRTRAVVRRRPSVKDMADLARRNRDEEKRPTGPYVQSPEELRRRLKERLNRHSDDLPEWILRKEFHHFRKVFRPGADDGMLMDPSLPPPRLLVPVRKDASWDPVEGVLEFFAAVEVDGDGAHNLHIRVPVETPLPADWVAVHFLGLYPHGHSARVRVFYWVDEAWWQHAPPLPLDPDLTPVPKVDMVWIGRVVAQRGTGLEVFVDGLTMMGPQGGDPKPEHLRDAEIRNGGDFFVSA